MRYFGRSIERMKALPHMILKIKSISEKMESLLYIRLNSQINLCQHKRLLTVTGSTAKSTCSQEKCWSTPSLLVMRMNTLRAIYTMSTSRITVKERLNFLQPFHQDVHSAEQTTPTPHTMYLLCVDLEPVLQRQHRSLQKSCSINFQPSIIQNW